jgi:hypothetical protein
MFGIALGILPLGPSSAFAAHELMYAVTTGNDLISFYSDAPGTILNARAINGLQGAEEIRGLTMGNGILYGLGSSSRLYTINPNTGTATQVGSGQFSTLLNGQAFGVAVGPSGVQVVSDLGQSLLINTSTGVDTAQPSLVYAAGDPHFGQTPRIDAVAYIATSGSWIAGDSHQNWFATLNPVTGNLNTIGPAGIDFSPLNGLSFSPTSGILYLAAPAASSDPAANLYTVNPATGAVTLVGLLGNPGDNILVRALVVVAP